MARPTRPEQQQARDTGRMAYRTEFDPVDERPLLSWGSFWDSEAERMTYEAVAAKNPRKQGEGVMSYTARLSAAVTGVYKQAGQRMPKRCLSREEWEKRKWGLKEKGEW